MPEQLCSICRGTATQKCMTCGDYFCSNCTEKHKKTFDGMSTISGMPARMVKIGEEDPDCTAN